MKIQSVLLLEYDRARAIAALGPNLPLAALRDGVGIHDVPLDQLKARLSKNLAYRKYVVDPSLLAPIVDHVMTQIENADPSPNKKYTQWMARQFAVTQNIAKLEDITSTLATYVDKFDKLNRKKRLEPPFNDINRYKLATDLMDKMDEYDDAILDDDKKVNAEKVYESPEVTIIKPLDEAAACKYGRGTRWCTAATQGTNYFDSYNRKGPLYILIPKNPQHDGEKYQLHFPDDQFMNEDDDEVSLKWLLEERFPELFEFFKKLYPWYFEKMLEFASDAVLEPLCKQSYSLIQDYVSEMLSDWEANDDYYYEWLRDEGYVNDDGDISDDAPSYLSYNDEARTIYDTITDSVDLTPKEVREYAKEMHEEDGSVLDVHNLDYVYIYALREIQDRSNQHSVGDVIDFIKKRLYISKDKDGVYSATLVRPR